jgi:hypothetical protein
MPKRNSSVARNFDDINFIIINFNPIAITEEASLALAKS